MIQPPRIRAQSGQIEEPEELKGKWCFTISMWSFDGEEMIGEPIGPFGPYETQKEAIEQSKKAAQQACEQIELREVGQVSGKYIDMKNGGLLRSWMEN